MQLSQPWALWLLTLLPIALLLGAIREHHSRRIQQAFALPHTAAQRWRTMARMATDGLALLTLIAALSGPQIWARQTGDVRQHLKLAVGLDVSKSMLAEDVLTARSRTGPSPVSNRLNSASHFALRLFEELAGEQAGLFFFARSGIEVVAPTRDQGFLRYMVRHTRLAELTESGSDLKTAMATGAALLGDGSNRGANAMVLISDGEDTENSVAELVAQAEQLNRDGVPVYTVGVGRTNAVFIPIRRPGTSGIEGFFTDREGRHLRTRLEPDILQAVAGSSGGRYFSMDDTTPQKLARTLLGQIARTAAPTSLPPVHGLVDLTPLLLVLALLFYSGRRLL